MFFIKLLDVILQFFSLQFLFVVVVVLFFTPFNLFKSHYYYDDIGLTLSFRIPL